MKKNMLFIVIVILVISVLYVFSTKKISPVPFDEKHAGITEEKKCFDCHASDKETPLSKKHPPKFECFKCHKITGG